MNTDNLKYKKVRKNSPKRVLLLTMPWRKYSEPCLALGILKSVLVQHNIPCDVLYLPIRLLRYIDAQIYQIVDKNWSVMDFVFTKEFEPDISSKQMSTLWQLCREITQGQTPNDDMLENKIKDKVDKIIYLRQHIIPKFLDDLMIDINFGEYACIGFSCFINQTFASLALAKRIKDKYPSLPIVFGGPAMAKPVGQVLAEAFSEIDIVAYGDGEPVVVPLLEAVCGQRSFSEVPNISYRNELGQVVDSKITIKIDLNESPIPDYDDFFLQREQILKEHNISFDVGNVFVESSRGCWWAKKSQCAFCGIEREASKWRHKKGEIVKKQLDELHAKYGLTVFAFSDSIMPYSYYGDLLPILSANKSPYVLFYEMKSNQSHEQIKKLAQAGVYGAQPGIESFSTSILKKMRKGVRAVQNIFTIYTMALHGIVPIYNILLGMPSESFDDYVVMLRFMRSLYHLPPPHI